MKKLSVLFLAALCTITVAAQKAKPAAKTISPLKNLADSASYAVGLSVASFYKQQGITGLNTTLVAKAISDAMGNKKTLLDEAGANNAVVTYMNQLQMKKSKVRIDESNKFLAQNKTRPGVKTTPSGLQYEVITEGSGEKVTVQDTVTVHYRGTYINGSGFDNSYDRGQPYTTDLLHVVAGWTEGLQLMTVGSKYKLYVPYTLGYGPADYNGIPGGSLLIFEIELLEIKKHRQ